MPAVMGADGRSLVCEAPFVAGEPLADWMAASGHALNTRCGGRGLCRGCGVEVLGGLAGCEGFRSVKACQIPLSELVGAVVTVPRISLQDRTITGVSAFDIDAHLERLGESQLDTGVGAAIDVGTTTLAIALWAESPGECLATASAPNPQSRFGDNVVSRIQFSLDHGDGDMRLHETLIGRGLYPLLESACATAGVSLQDIRHVVVAGNPAMLHTVAGEPLEGLSKFPFRPVFLEQRRMPGSILGLESSAEINLLGSLGPFVGSDISAGALACGLIDARLPALLIDFGTNGEILLKTATGYLATATAAGPAFEGGRLACGAMAGKGVVSGVEGWDAAKGTWQLRSIKGGAEQFHGIAGAAYIDFLALAVEFGIVSATGRFDPSHPAVQEVAEGESWGRKRVVLADRVFITEADVAELIQAKAAIQAGWATLLDVAGLSASELSEVFIAGGFGYHLTPRHAAAIGLLPYRGSEAFRLVGNSSLGGASLALLGRNAAASIEALRAQVELVELNKTDTFEDHYIDAMTLAPSEA